MKDISERRRRRKRKRFIWKLQRILLRAAVLFLLVTVVSIVFIGGKFLLQKFSGENLSQEQPYIEAFEEESGPLVVLDAGHGGNDQGTSSGKILEKDINLKVAKLVEKELTKNGIRVILTRDTDRRVELEERAGLANEKNASLFVSIHCNYNEDSTAVEGMEFYYREGSDDGKTVAEALSSRFDETEDVVNRGTRTEDFHVLRETKMPAVLVELGFLSNASEREKLNQKEYQKLLAENIAETILESELITGISEETDTEL